MASMPEFPEVTVVATVQEGLTRNPQGARRPPPQGAEKGLKAPAVSGGTSLHARSRRSQESGEK
jgi:hypothetical protein